MGVPIVRARLPVRALEAGLSSTVGCSWPNEKFLLGPTLDSHFYPMEFEFRFVLMRVFYLACRYNPRTEQVPVPQQK